MGNGLSVEGSVEALRVVSTVMCGILYWDHLSTLPLEYKLFWSRPGWNLAKVLYLGNRYITLAMYSAFVWPMWATLSLGACKHLVYVGPVTPVLTFFCSNMIFLLRCCAIWSWSRPVTAYLSLLIIANIIMGSWCTSGTYVVAPTHRGCWVGGRRDVHGAFWFFACFYDLSTFVLSTAKVWVMRKGGSHSDLSYILLRDGILYFLCVFAVNFANAMFYAVGSPLIMPMLTGPVIVLTSILAARLMLNLKGYPDNMPSSYPTRPSNSAGRAAGAIALNSAGAAALAGDTGTGSVPSWAAASLSRIPASELYKKDPTRSPPELSSPSRTARAMLPTVILNHGVPTSHAQVQRTSSDWTAKRKPSSAGSHSEWTPPQTWGASPTTSFNDHSSPVTPTTPRRTNSVTAGQQRLSRVPVPPAPLPAPVDVALPGGNFGPYSHTPPSTDAHRSGDVEYRTVASYQ